MPLKDILKKKDKIHQDDASSPIPTSPDVPEFTFMRTDTNTQEIIEPPAYDGDNDLPSPQKRLSRFLKHSSASAQSANTSTSRSPSGEKRLSQRLHLTSRSRNASSSSVNLPSDLPAISIDEVVDPQEKEARWEERATMLAQAQGAATQHAPPSEELNNMSLNDRDARSRSPSVGRVSDAVGDENIQEAIRLHEAGDLTKSTEMFGRLADPKGANNALSQVLYGLALRHGWGIAPNPGQAVIYLQAAASNSAAIESDALKAGMKKGGAAKGELVLAIFELANCFRHGWGVDKDAVAARQYYETAANLGDTDAMNEAAWCYLEGYGGKKDKFVAAKYYRLAEEKGNKTLGNSWIWKDKYNRA